MSAAPTTAWMDGALVPFSEAKVPIEDRGLQFGESLYEVIPVTAGQVRALREHGARMRDGAARIGLGGAPDDARWMEIATRLLEADPLTEGLIYAQLTGGCAPRSHAPATRPKSTFFAYLRAHAFPTADTVSSGIRAVTAPDTRWAHCDLKTTMLLSAVMAKYEARRAGAGEALFVGADGLLREGSSSNAFIVEGGLVIGVPQTGNILPGVTRGLMEHACAATQTRRDRQPIPIDRLRSADEVFVTSTSRLVMPVVELDGNPVRDGRAGPVAIRLAAQMRRDLELE